MILSVKRTVRLPGSEPALGGHSAKTGEFQQVLEGKVSAQTDISAVPIDPFQAMRQLSVRLGKDSSISNKELLLYQVRAGEYGVRVELATKIAEGVNVSLRKLQQTG